MEFTAVSLLVNLVYMVIALAVCRLVLYWFDKSLGIDFKEHFLSVIIQNPNSLAIYLGARLIFVGLVASAFLR